MRYYVLLSSFIVLLSVSVYAQKKNKSFIVMSYNVENLFDTINDPVTKDDDFTPSGSKAWTYERYSKKLTDISRVIMSIPEKELPALIGLAEIENRGVLEDLVSQRGLNRGKYSIIHEDSEDPRGIECALLYRKEFFKYKTHEYLPVNDSRDPEYKYRGILYVSGTAPDGSSLHIFVNHWKSRSGGTEKTERQRMLAAIVLRRQLDLLLSRESDFKVIIMGDFNDEPTNRTMTNALNATNKRKNQSLGEHYNLFYDLHNLQDKGTYNYRGTWNMLDQVIVSYSLLNQPKGLSVGFEDGRILSEEWMMFEHEKYGKMPSATYGGPNYYGGPSDHLPVYIVCTY